MSIETIQKLSAHFDPNKIKSREGGGGKKLLYLSIDDVITRINEVLPDAKDVQIQIVDRSESGPYKVIKKTKVDNQWQTIELDQYTLTIVVALTIDGSRRDGIGSDELFEFRFNKWDKVFEPAMDMDKAWKTAYANAIKKAAVQFGVGLYLWDAEERAKIERGQAGDQDEVHDDDFQQQAAAQVVRLDDDLLAMLGKKREEIGYSKDDFIDAVKTYVKQTYGKDCDGLPKSLVMENRAKTEIAVNGLCNYLDNQNKKK